MKPIMYIWFIIILTASIFLLPIFFIMLTSVKEYGDIVSGVMFPSNYTLQNYESVLYAPGFRFIDFMFNSMIISSVSTFLNVLISFPAAYSMSRFKTGGDTLSSYILSLRLLPPIIFVVPMFILYQNVGLLDTHLGLILIYTVFNLPLTVLVLRSFINDIPIEIEEAALIDGCSRTRLIFNIVLPLSLPGIIAVSILTFLASWNEYLFALILTLKKAATVNVAASLFVTAYAIRYGEIAASVVMSMIPPLLFIFIVQRNLVRGLTLGALKK